MTQPLAIDLYCGLGGWTEGLLAEGWRVIGFDIERHVYGEHRYPGMLVLQDVRTLHGSQFKDADLIVSSSPCEEFSYRAMPWKRAKALGPPVLGMELFAQAARIQREACEAAGRFIPMVQENVRGAQKWVGQARWHYGSYYLWGDVLALMPMTFRAQKFNPDGTSHGTGSWFAIADSKERGARGQKNSGGSWFNMGSPGQKVVNQNPVNGGWFGGNIAHPLRTGSSKSPARKAASAAIAKIPFPLACHIARSWKPVPMTPTVDQGASRV